MRIMNNLIVGLNGGVNRVTSARVVEGIGAYSNPFRPAPFSAKPCDCVEGTVKNHCVSHISKSATVPPVSVNTGPTFYGHRLCSSVAQQEEHRFTSLNPENTVRGSTLASVAFHFTLPERGLRELPKESAKSEVSLREEITETLGCERHHSPTFGTSSGCDVKQLPAFAKPGHTFRFITKTVIFSILIILIPVWAGFGLPGWVAWLCLIAFLAGLRQANRDYDLLVSPSTTRYKSKTVSKANASCVEVVADTANSVTGSHAEPKDKRRAEKFSSYNSLLSPFSPGASLSVSHKNKQGTGNGALL